MPKLAQFCLTVTPDKSSSHRKQKIEIYYKAAGIINIANEDCVALDGRLGMQNRKKKTA